MRSGEAPPGAWAPVFCSLVPREIFQLAGVSPVEIAPPDAPDRSGRYQCALCDNLCSWVRHLLGRLQSAGPAYPFVVVPNSCDAMEKLHDALARHRAPDRLFLLDVPHAETPAGVRYLAGQYREILDRLAVIDHAPAAPASPAGQGEPEGGGKRTGPRVGVAGSVYPNGLFQGVLEAAGAEVHVLRRCGMALPGAEPAALAGGESLDAFCERLAGHYLREAVCPRMTGGRFVEYLLQQAAHRQLAGLVVPVLKFCDTYHLAADTLKRRLPVDFPILLVEGDLTTGFGEQAVTRLEAFVEQLAGRNKAVGAERGGRRLVAGVDIGSTQVKAVLMDDGLHILGTFVRPTTGKMSDSCADAIDRLLAHAGTTRDRVAAIGVTGYGRKSVSSDRVATEISCHARGVGRFFPRPATVVDVGGQDSKVIVTDGRGGVIRFTMNDKCAAGTGRFLDSMVRTLDLGFDAFSRLSIEADREVPVSSMCSVFAESEVISLTARGEPLSGIARGINASIARRIAGMVRRVDGQAPFVLTGGVSQIPGFVRELERELRATIEVLEYSPYAGAVGAALHALEGE